MTVVGDVLTSPASMTMSTAWSSASLTSQPKTGVSSSPGSRRVLDRSGSPSSSRRAWTTAWSGMRTPTVFFFAWRSRRGTSFVAGRMKVYGPGVTDRIARKTWLSTWTSCPS